MSQSTPERTLYALTPSQELTIMNRTWCIHRNVVNIPTSIIANATQVTRPTSTLVKTCTSR